MNEIIELINDKTVFSNISDKTRQNYTSIINSLKKKFIKFGGEIFDLSIFNNEEFIMTLDSSLATSTQRTNLVSLKYILDKYKKHKDIELMNKELYKKLSKKIDGVCETWQEDTDKQTYITEYSIDKLYEIMETYEEDSIEYLFFATSLLVPPRRRDWGSAIFVEEIPKDTDERTNYVLIKDNTVYLQFDNYKNSAKTKTYEKIIDDSEYSYLNKFKLRLNPNKLKELLINSYKNNPREEVFMKNNFKAWDNYVINLYKGFDQNTFRHCFAQDLFNKNNKLTEYYLKKIAWDFGDKHTHTMRLHYTNPNMNDEFLDEIEEEQDLNRFKLIEKINESKKITLEFENKLKIYDELVKEINLS